MLGALSNQDAPWHHVLAALRAQHGPGALGIGELGVPDGRPHARRSSPPADSSVTRVPPERIIARREMTVAMSTRDEQITGTVTYDGDALRSLGR